MPDDDESLSLSHEQARLRKVEALRVAGEEPFKLGFDRSHLVGDLVSRYTDLAAGAETGDVVRVAGRVMTIRRMGKLAFADLRDVTGRIQLFARTDRLGDSFEKFCDLDMGDWVGASGEIVTTRKGELSILLDSFQLVSKSLRPWPEKWHGLRDVELRYRQRYLDLATNPRARQILEIRSQVVAHMRRWLMDRDFIEVETPMLQPMHGGALAKPFVTYHEELESNLYLRIAPELYLKRLVIGGMERVFEINRNFRNEGVSVKYNPEFTMLELYQSFADYNDMADLLEEMIRDIATSVLGTTKVTWQGNEIDFSKPFRRTTLMDLVRETGADPEGDLVAECERLGVPHDPKWPWGKLLVEIYEKKVEPTLIQPTFAMNYPHEVSPLARRHRSDERFTEHLDLIIVGMEIGPAYSELIDPLDQRRRFEEQAELMAAGDEEAHVIDEDFIRALEYGMPPTGGLGMGIDRLVMVLTDSPSIREVILFPALRREH